MTQYRRLYIPGGTYFFTVVTLGRLPILTTKDARSILREAWLDVNHRFPFTTEAICLLPDHIHCIWKLPDGDEDFSIRWKEIKRLFSKAYNLKFGRTLPLTQSQEKRYEGILWQRRFWEHAIRNETDLYRHFDYIHFNPVKHGYVKNVADWPWFSFQQWVRKGYYDPSWGQDNDEVTILFGE